jgi:hypothetical protein
MKKLTIAASILLCAATAMPALAQDIAPATPEIAAGFTDEQLKSFAQAAVKVQIISQQAQMQMLQAIESVEGLDMDIYNSIVQQAQADSGLASRISQFMQDYANEAGIPTTSSAGEQAE